MAQLGYLYIENSAMFLLGVEIGDNVIIAVGSIVTKRFPGNINIRGNPVRILGNIKDFEAKNERLQS